MRIRLGAVALAVPVCLFAAEYDNTYQKAFPLSGGGERRLIVAVIHGGIRITADSGHDVRVKVHEHWSADTPEDLESARREVILEMKQDGNIVRVELGGPFRDRWREHRDGPRAKFRHDVEVQVPREIALDLKTVNGGEIIAANTAGDWSLRNVNGGVTMENLSGSGSAETVNGRIKASFAQNPARASLFKTVNGAIDLAFQPGLNADLRLETMHGEAYTDFEVSPVASPVTVEKGSDGHRYRIDRAQRIRIGSGGIEHQIKTLNGSIRIRKYGK